MIGILKPVGDTAGAVDPPSEWLMNAIAEGVYRGLSRWNGRILGGAQHAPPDGQDPATLLNAVQVATLLGLRVRRVYELAGRGILPSVRIGRQVRFRRRAIEGWAARQEQAAMGTEHT